jgi:hypothetical protein
MAKKMEKIVKEWNDCDRKMASCLKDFSSFIMDFMMMNNDLTEEEFDTCMRILLNVMAFEAAIEKETSRREMELLS